VPIAQAFLSTAARIPQRIAVVDGQRRVTYGQLASMARRAAARICAETTRDHVGIYLPASAGFKVALFGTLAAGKVAVPLNLFLAGEELSGLIDHAELDLVVTCAELAARLPSGAVRALDVGELTASAEKADPSPARGRDDLAVLLYTSGSTGRPKGVRLTHGNLLANAEGSARAGRFCREDRVLGALPPFHTFALTTTVLAPLLTGASVSTLPRFHPETALDLAAEGEVSVILGVPSMYRLIARAQRARPRELKALRLVISGGERLPGKVREDFRAAFGTEIHEGYGLTECSPVVALNRPGENRPGTVGRPLEHLEVEIRGPGGEVLPAGEDGEIWVRGDSVMSGYHHDEQGTAAVLQPGGWLRTGDIGRLDPDGYLAITGRLKELIIVGGENVHPGEVEAALAAHPAVAECAVLGAPDRRRGEQVVAFLVLRGGEEAGERELRAHCRERLAGYKIPREFLFEESLPKLPTGKVNRRALAGRLGEEAE
jgi:long-chain acyl-CoA synthetase